MQKWLQSKSFVKSKINIRQTTRKKICRLKGYCLKAKEKNPIFYILIYFFTCHIRYFRRLDGSGHIGTTLIFLKKRKLFRKIYTNLNSIFKANIHVLSVLLCKIKVYRLQNHFFLKNLKVNLLSPTFFKCKNNNFSILFSNAHLMTCFQRQVDILNAKSVLMMHLYDNWKSDSR